ncbi:MAG TPA: hypothetical protein VFH56_06640 [Acidimicrobiales bacterium]|nr:hypothetical protein [Acidimicrobiales bacterium]
MNESAVSIVAACVGTVVGLITLLGVAVKWVLVPYLERELLRPVKETHHQVTVNHHSSDEPTILDRLDDVQQEVREARSEVRSVRGDLSRHLLNSEEVQAEGHREAQRMWSAIEAIAKTEPPKD